MLLKVGQISLFFLLLTLVLRIAMITNFHAPKSTLMMQAAAFAGYDFLMEAYKVAIKEQYKFSTYGDAMLII